jgi:hypothetical protein
MKPGAWVVVGMLVAGVVAWCVGREHEDPVRGASDFRQTSAEAEVADAGAGQPSLETPIGAREPDELGTRSVASREQRDPTRVRLHGHARDQNGEPILDREVWLARGGSAKVDPDRGSLWGRSWKEPVEVVGSGKDGAFELFAPGSGEWWLCIAPRGDRDEPEELYRPAVKVEIARDERDREVDVLGYRGLVVCGSVVTPDGTPAPGALVEASLSRDGPVVAHVGADEHGNYCVGPLPPGRCLVAASLARRFLPSAPRASTAGSIGVTLDLVQGGRCVVSIVDARTGEPTPAELRYVLREGREDDGPWEEWVPDYKETFDVQGLDAGVYDWIASTNSREIGVVREVHVEEDGLPQEIVLRVGPSASLILASKLWGECADKRGSWEVELYSDGAFIQADWLGAEESKLDVVPPGPIRVRAKYCPPNARPETEEGNYWLRKGVRILDVVADADEVRRVELVPD